MDGELKNFPPRRVLRDSALGGRLVVGSDQIIAHRIDSWVDPGFVIESDKGGGPWGIERTGRWLRPLGA